MGTGSGGFDNWMRTDAILTSYSPFPFVAREARVCSLWQKLTMGQALAEKVWYLEHEDSRKKNSA